MCRSIDIISISEWDDHDITHHGALRVQLSLKADHQPTWTWPKQIRNNEWIQTQSNYNAYNSIVYGIHMYASCFDYTSAYFSLVGLISNINLDIGSKVESTNKRNIYERSATPSGTASHVMASLGPCANVDYQICCKYEAVNFAQVFL